MIRNMYSTDCAITKDGNEIVLLYVEEDIYQNDFGIYCITDEYGNIFEFHDNKWIEK